MAGVTTIAVANQKGGVGKTTTVASVGAALAEGGHRVLLVDMDPQGSLTFSLGIDPEDLAVTVGDVLTGRKPAPEAIVNTEDAVDLLPSNIDLTRAEQRLINATGREHRLAAGLQHVTAEYDWILIDCPPSLGIMTVGALTAADGVVIPLQCETLSHRGVGELLDTIFDVRAYVNTELDVIGVLPTLFDGRTRHSQEVLEAVATGYDLRVLEPAVPKSIRFAEAPAIGRSILDTARRHKGAWAYRQVAQWFQSEYGSD